MHCTIARVYLVNWTAPPLSQPILNAQLKHQPDSRILPLQYEYPPRFIGVLKICGSNSGRIFMLTVENLPSLVQMNVEIICVEISPLLSVLPSRVKPGL